MYGKTVRKRVRAVLEETTRAEAHVEVDVPVYVCQACEEQAEAEVTSMRRQAADEQLYVSGWKKPEGWIDTVVSDDKSLCLCGGCLSIALAAVSLELE